MHCCPRSPRSRRDWSTSRTCGTRHCGRWLARRSPIGTSTCFENTLATTPTCTGRCWCGLPSSAAWNQEEVDALEARDPDPDVEIRTLEVRAARPERKAKEAVWRAVFVDRAVPADRIIDLAAAFWRPGQEDLLREYTRRYLETVTGLQGGMMLVAVLSRGFFPSAVGDAEFLAAAQKTADTEGLNPALRQALLERSDILRRMLRAREA